MYTNEFRLHFYIGNNLTREVLECIHMFKS